MAFSYELFKSPSESIRLLTIEPDVDERLICCTIDHYEFSSTHAHQVCPAYTAVSYTWSPVTPRQTIKLNGRNISVGYNLWLLLTHLRRAGDQSLVWVDALCIDQDNVLEKNAQVSIMRLIYQQASQIFAWLGEASIGMQPLGESKPSFEAEAGSDAVIKKLNDHQEIGPPTGVYVQDTLGGELSASSVSLWNGLASLCARNYWKRTWILQEISQNPDSVTVHCGTHNMKLNTLRREIRRALDKLRNFLQYGKVDVSGCPAESNLEKETYGSGLKQQLRKRADEISKNTLLTSPMEWNELPLLTWFQIASHTFCSDPRDKVYSVVDLANGATRHTVHQKHGKKVKFIQPDYSKSTSALLWEVLTHCCESVDHHALDIRLIRYLTSCLEISIHEIQHMLDKRTSDCPAHLFNGHGGSWEWVAGHYREIPGTAGRRNELHGNIFTPRVDFGMMSTAGSMPNPRDIRQRALHLRAGVGTQHMW
ncbi:hypothetical protein LTR99_004947 [Exophiala xenobiotica]|uniref:Heterokaryon incompatibility domain-containing protein n=1 Tax=Vermiconidia calcicola TaxID=1690605 RepID=A0AAV9QCP4_9PEZI|nr:hypothetical protein LTR92_000692 [Exophiala xenobiotica]KAK5536399.1 hypothetical protein LTR23_007978 [Chaetothyriales sp. CCFEE 6169]KAK5540226.1 hypothetical protein LTR25_003932 [Vermiconidia calcicola]KAK5265870.1 hypothetical protein LTR96_008770 [Exophiala xenobiotica]KAK5304490.1 hypothetical protein LTR99_004947 [Exophiala xenobiotica]